MTWIVVVDRPYYPNVEEYDSEEAAKKAASLLVEENKDSTMYDSHIYVAKVKSKIAIKTDW